MNLPFYIARRYLFSRKRYSTINIISAISACGVALVTAALICTLSVFNGFQDLVAHFFTAFDPELKITAVEGKVFNPSSEAFDRIRRLKTIAVWSETLQDNAMVQYRGRERMAVIKGVEDNFEQLTAIDSILYGDGHFLLHDSIVEYGILGGELMSELGTGIQFMEPLKVYAPRRSARINIANPTTAFNSAYLFSPGVIFIVNQEKYDSGYILTSLDFARKLFGYDKEVSAIELKLKNDASSARVKQQIKEILGAKYRVEDRYEQQADVFKIMKIEKYISYIFLTFILIIASFNIIGSLSMLIIDKREDTLTLKKLGADDGLISKIFLYEGSLISFYGTLFGLILGVGLCFIQEKFGVITLGNGGANFVVDAYPVSVHALDVLIVFLTVVVVGYLSVRYPVRYLSRRLLNKKDL